MRQALQVCETAYGTGGRSAPLLLSGLQAVLTCHEVRLSLGSRWCSRTGKHSTTLLAQDAISAAMEPAELLQAAAQLACAGPGACAAAAGPDPQLQPRLRAGACAWPGWERSCLHSRCVFLKTSQGLDARWLATLHAPWLALRSFRCSKAQLQSAGRAGGHAHQPWTPACDETQSQYQG